MGRLIFKNGIVEDYTIVLSTRDYRHLGQITGVRDINSVNKLNGANELSFTICKYDLLKYDENSFIPYNAHLKIKQELWEQIVDLKLVWVKELNEYFEIKVSITDALETTKAITAVSLCEAELGQTNIYTTEINTESDIGRDDYDVNFPTVFYRNPEKQSDYNKIWDSEDKYSVYTINSAGNKVLDRDATYELRYNILVNSSLLHRVLGKVLNNYTIEHVDASLCNLQRTFSIDDSAIYDFLTGECSEQFDCLFRFNSATRGISAYDLYTVCNDCGERGEFWDKCPECGSVNLKYFGEDTTILVDKNNLTDSIQLDSNVDSIKNCFKLAAGDEIMTAAIRMVNPNGSDYIYYFSKNQRNDMPEELGKEGGLLDSYNELVESYDEEYKEIVNDIYELTDKLIYLESGMMPSVEYIKNLSDVTDPKEGKIYILEDKVYVYNGIELELQDENAEFYTNLIPSADVISAAGEGKKLTASNLSPLGLSSVTKSTSTATVNSALKNYAKVYVKTGYVKVEPEGEFIFVGEDNEGWNYGTWTGKFVITNYSDKEDTYTTSSMRIKVYDNYEEFTRQKILKTLASEDTEEGSVFDVLALDELEDFKRALTLYGQSRLESFYDAIQGALDILIELDQASEHADLYEVLYVPYYDKLQACQAELDKRKAEIVKIEEELDLVNERRTEIQEALDFEKYLGDYYDIFCMYRREQKFTNDNYISDGLSNAEIIEKALEFTENAKKELKKSGELQYTISTTLNNLLVLPEFKPIVDKFELGNWIRVKIDGQLYRLRLMSYTIDFSNIQTINVEFATATRVGEEADNMADEIHQIISAASSMATTYTSVSKQAEKGSEAKDNINNWTDNGLDSGTIPIYNNNQEVTYGKHGILCRSYDDITNSYSPKAVKIIHNNLAFTDNDWKSVRLALGEHEYIEYDEITGEFENKTGYGLSADFVTAGIVSGSQIIGGDIYSDNYSPNNGIGSHIGLSDGTIEFGDLFTVDSQGNVVANSLTSNNATITGGSLKVGNNFNVDTSGNLKASNVNISGTITSNNATITGGSFKVGSNFNVDSSGNLTAKNANITGTITATAGTIGGCSISNGVLQVPAANITGTVTASQIDATNLKVNSANIGTVYISDLYLDSSTKITPKKLSFVTDIDVYSDLSSITAITDLYAGSTAYTLHGARQKASFLSRITLKYYSKSITVLSADDGSTSSNYESSQGGTTDLTNTDTVVIRTYDSSGV